MPARFKIIGYHGQHDEAGAIIEGPNPVGAGKVRISTPSVSEGQWGAYHALNDFMVAAMNLQYTTLSLIGAVRSPKPSKRR